MPSLALCFAHICYLTQHHDVMAANTDSRQSLRLFQPRRWFGSASDAVLRHVAVPSESPPAFSPLVIVLCANSHSSLMLWLCVCPPDKLDGLRTGTKRKRDWEAIASRMEDYLQLPDDYDTRASEPGKKRVRWADLEEKKDADRKRAIGFVVGQTDWEKITDESGHLAEKALNRTKYI